MSQEGLEVLAVVRDITERRHQKIIRTARLRVHEAVLSMHSAEETKDVLKVISSRLGGLDVPFADCSNNQVDDGASSVVRIFTLQLHRSCCC